MTIKGKKIVELLKNFSLSFGIKNK